MYNSNTDSLGLILGVEVFFSLGQCSGALCLTNDKLHLIQTTISHIPRASGQSLHSYNNNDYQNTYDPYPFHLPTKYEIIFFVMLDNVYTH